MIAGKRVLAVVPARGGSKGLKLKNLRPLHGVPLVTLAGRCAHEVPAIDRAVVSTDHPGIAEAARAGGLEVPFYRPKRLSSDRVADWDVLIHTLKEVERIDGVEYGVIVMLQPTSPLRRPDDVQRTVAMLVDDNWDAVWTVSKTDSKAHPLKQLTVSGPDGTLRYYDPASAKIIARQQLTPVYHRNGVCYAMTRQCLVQQKSIAGARTCALVLDGLHISIDTQFDLDLVEWILDRRDAAHGGEPRRRGTGTP